MTPLTTAPQLAALPAPPPPAAAVVAAAPAARPRGFAALKARAEALRASGDTAAADELEQRVRAIAAAGGRRAHEMGTAHRYTSDEGRRAGVRSAQVRAAHRARTYGRAAPRPAVILAYR